MRTRTFAALCRHQVESAAGAALLGSRGWVSSPEEGVRRTFHSEGLSAWLEFQETYFTPADIEGLTLENVRFCKSGDWKPIAMAEVPPRVFSEVMRDVDLAVSVAHRGGVDPEASARRESADAAGGDAGAASVTNVRSKAIGR